MTLFGHNEVGAGERMGSMHGLQKHLQGFGKERAIPILQRDIFPASKQVTNSS